MASAYNITALTDYVDAKKDELFVKSVAGAKTMEYVDLMPNVKFKEALIMLNSGAEMQADSCGFNGNSTDVYGEKFIEAHPFKFEKEWCWLDVQKKALNSQLRFEAGRETVPFEETLIGATTDAIKLEVEKALWGGNDTAGITGYVADIKNGGEATEVQKGATIVETVDALVAAIPAVALAKGVDIFMSLTSFREYVQALNAYCCANRPIQDAAVENLVYAGDSRIRIIPVIGLEGANFMTATSRENLVAGTDIVGAEGVYKVWRDETDDMLRMRVRSTLGTAYKYGDEIVYANL